MSSSPPPPPPSSSSSSLSPVSRLATTENSFFYSNLSSSSSATSSSSSTTTTTISDLPVDVISLVFEHLPLAEVLRSHSLVCRVFYEAHRQHCRSSVKRLTLVGHYMVTVERDKPPRPQSEAERKLERFKYARLVAAGEGHPSRGNAARQSSSVLNPSTVHLKLVPGREAEAFNALGAKFKTVVQLELYHLAMERFYGLISQMILEWGKTGGSGANQLADLKVFFAREFYDVEGNHIKGRQDWACFAHLLSAALTPSRSPALRRLTFLLPFGKERHGSYHLHNRYRGERLRWVDLSQLEAIDAVGFNACRLPLSLGVGARNHPQHLKGSHHHLISNLHHLTINLHDLPAWTLPAAGLAILRQLHSLTFTSLSSSFTRSVAFRRLLTELERVDGEGARGRPLEELKALTLMQVQPSLSKVLRECIIPLTTAEGERENRRLSYLRLNFVHGTNTLIPKKLDLRVDAAFRVSFQALTTLHLVNSKLLHRPRDLTKLASIFPNLAHLRLEGNYRTTHPRNTSGVLVSYLGLDCSCCYHHLWNVRKALKKNPPSSSSSSSRQQQSAADLVGLDLQHLASSISPRCKEAFVERAEAVWPRLATLTLQIDDFYEHELEKNGVDLQYLLMSETLRIRDPKTGAALPEEARTWTVEKVPY